MAAHVLDAVLDQHVDGLARAGLAVFVGDQRLALGPEFDALEQGACEVPARLAGGEGRVQVDMRLDEGRHHQVAGGIQLVCRSGQFLRLRNYAGDTCLRQLDAKQAAATTQPGVDDIHGVLLSGHGFRRRLTGRLSTPSTVLGVPAKQDVGAPYSRPGLQEPARGSRRHYSAACNSVTTNWLPCCSTWKRTLSSTLMPSSKAASRTPKIMVIGGIPTLSIGPWRRVILWPARSILRTSP